MNFFAWGNLFFAMGGAIPIIIHLLHRQKYKRVPWAAMEFLLQAIKKTQRRLRLENLILLLLRILLMILLALAIAGPYLKAAPALLPSQTDVHHLIVVDNSYSMGFKRGSKSYLDLARDAADKLVDSFDRRLSEADRVSVLLASAYPETHLGQSNKIRTIKEQIGAIKLSHNSSSMYRTFQLAAETMRNSRNQEQRIYLFTDLQRTGWEGADDVEAKRFAELLKGLTAKPGVKVSLIDVGAGAVAADNRAVTGLRVSDNVVSVKQYTVFTADLYNWSNVSYPSVEVKFLVDGSLAGTVVTPLPPNSPMSVTYRHEFLEPGPHFVEAAIDPDQLDVDDRRFLALDVKAGIQVLIVDGEPETPPDHSDADYLKLMLTHSPYNVTGPVTAEMFTGEALDRFDFVALCNVQSMTQDKIERLEEYVRRGGGLFINLGDRVDRASWNELLWKDGKGLLPGEIGEVGGSSPEIQPRIPLHVRRYENRHPMFSKFTGPFSRAPFGLVFYQHLKLEKADPESVLADLDDPLNSPLFVEKRFGDGKVLVYTSTIDEEWSDRLAGAPPFGAMIWQLSPWLASRPLAGKNLQVGEPIHLQLASDQYARLFDVETPQEGRVTTAPDAPRPDSKWFSVFYPGRPQRKPEDGKPPTNEGLRHAGRYALIRPKTGPQDEERLVSYFACNLPPRSGAPEELLRCEGNLERIEPPDLEKRYPDFKFEVVGRERPQEAAAPARTSFLWRYVLYVMLAFMAAETFLAWYFGRYKQ